MEAEQHRFKTGVATQRLSRECNRVRSSFFLRCCSPLNLAIAFVESPFVEVACSIGTKDYSTFGAGFGTPDFGAADFGAADYGTSGFGTACLGG